ncbi:lytic transglycosylase domain-containing protein [Pseudooceanicola sp. CBS1P-1]|uniref:Transglycosylase SLT domain-containing protein n=1 Tax=Pseudooceanicola albus TaxID=2692189 RepID=A0A6L7FWM2_9RHOB|nr:MULTISPECIES: lytic transglycosylase domain-containing protein [Pseudooceanicola]MBT9383407.1 lytic transglycosylase domain-containing protein [Pseudooceanicola endophyticus]MXN16271.1 transglycosylase SLT domain-containing protein [Pseudooceanicola albus]
MTGKRVAAAAVFGLAIFCGQQALAGTGSEAGRLAQFRAKTKVLDGRLSEQYAASVALTPRSFSAPSQWDGQGYSGNYAGPYLDMARSAASRHAIPVGLFLRLVQQESGWNAQAVSAKGAVGLAQLMPGTARHMGADARDPYQNLDAGARYLAAQYRDFGSWPLALAAYNAGPEVVRRYGGIPPYAETQAYVAAIWGS